MLIDTHTHLTDTRLDRDKIIANMQKDRLEKLITVGYDFCSSLGGLKIAEENPNIYCALGIHPSDTLRAKDSEIFEIATKLGNEKVVAAGEIGLDYHYENTDRLRQQEFLIKQIEAYSPSGLPFIFHLRDAYEDMYKIISERQSLLLGGAVMHCFSGSLETAVAYIKLGFFISFSGTITYPNSKKFTQIIKEIPRDKILIETDCPYLSPQPMRGKTNQPSFVKYQAEMIASILDESVEDIEKMTGNNAYSLFKKMKRN